CDRRYQPAGSAFLVCTNWIRMPECSSRITASGNSISCSLRLQWIQLILFPESSIKHYAWPSCCAVVVARRLLTPAWSQYPELCPDLCACLQKELTISSFSPIWWHSTPRACITATTSFP